MTTVQATFPAPPEAVWGALPAGVDAIRGKGPFFNSQYGSVSCRTGASLRSWGQEIVAQVRPGPHGTTLVVNTNLKFGLFDWGEGKRIGTKFINAVSGSLRMDRY